MSNYRISVENSCPNIKVKIKQVKNLAQMILLKERILKAEINIVFVDDQYILRLNRQYLNKDTITDVLSFILTDETDDYLEGEVYANIEQIIRQADEYQVPFDDELCRIVIHGLLHLIGFDDQTEEQKQVMTEKEDHYLAIITDELKKKG